MAWLAPLMVPGRRHVALREKGMRREDLGQAHPQRRIVTSNNSLGIADHGKSRSWPSARRRLLALSGGSSRQLHHTRQTQCQKARNMNQALGRLEGLSVQIATVRLSKRPVRRIVSDVESVIGPTRMIEADQFDWNFVPSARFACGAGLVCDLDEKVLAFD